MIQCCVQQEAPKANAPRRWPIPKPRREVTRSPESFALPGDNEISGTSDSGSPAPKAAQRSRTARGSYADAVSLVLYMFSVIALTRTTQTGQLKGYGQNIIESAKGSLNKSEN